MKKQKFKRIAAVILVCVMLFNISAIFVAAEEREARETNCSVYSINFNISSTGIAETSVQYAAKEGIFTWAKLSVKIQKQNLLFFWTNVDIGTKDDVWEGYCSKVNGSIVYDLQLPKKGTYRAIVKVEFFGNTDVTDTMELTMEEKYE